MIRIVFFDFDYTLYSHLENAIPDSAIKALKKLQENDIKVFLCTGRCPYELKNFNFKDLKLDGAITANGLYVYDNKETIYEKYIDGKLKDKLTKDYQNNSFPIVLVTKNGQIINYVNDNVVNVQNAISTPIPKIVKYDNQEFFMASFYFDENEKTILDPYYDLSTITYWHPKGVDIIPKGCDKSFGIQKVLDHYHLKLEETMAFGDGYNDIPMLRYVNTSIAMENANEDVKANADFITKSCDDNGIEFALKHFNLI